jgi:hypothetical protein
MKRAYRLALGGAAATPERCEGEVAGLGELCDADLTASSEQLGVATTRSTPSITLHQALQRVTGPAAGGSRASSGHRGMWCSIVVDIETQRSVV